MVPRLVVESQNGESESESESRTLESESESESSTLESESESESSNLESESESESSILDIKSRTSKLYVRVRVTELSLNVLKITVHHHHHLRFNVRFSMLAQVGRFPRNKAPPLCPVLRPLCPEVHFKACRSCLTHSSQVFLCLPCSLALPPERPQNFYNWTHEDTTKF